MHDIEPYYGWQHLYNAANDVLSPFFNQEYSETEFTYSVYNYLIHPQWDCFGSATLYCKILYTDYDEGFCIIEFIGEWNDCLYNDVMYLKRNLVEILINKGVRHFILLGENIFNFHYSDDCYYQEWYEELEDGWICALNFLQHVTAEFRVIRLDNYFHFLNEKPFANWKKFNPQQLYEKVNEVLPKYLSG